MLPTKTRILECQECGACLTVGGGSVQVDDLVEEVTRRLDEGPAPGVAATVPIGVSMRHVHMSRSVLDALYGEGHKLQRLRDLKQPGEFAAKETVAIIGPSMKAITSVRILGPLRNYTQAELSRTDGIFLGIDPPIRDSGDLRGSPSITLVGPKGSLELKEGAIRATRHLHITLKQSEKLGLRNGQYVRARIRGERALTLDWVLVRASSSAALELHLDTDDANAAGVRCAFQAEIMVK
jgi:propanediol utilization protein